MEITVLWMEKLISGLTKAHYGSFSKNQLIPNLKVIACFTTMNKPEFFIKSCDIIYLYDLLSPKANLVAC